MATSRHSHPKDKASAASSLAPSPGGGRRSPKPPGSPDPHMPATTDRSKPTAARNVKPKPAASPAKSPATAGKRQPLAKKPAEKPPSPSRVPQRTLLTPATSRDKSAKPRSPSPSPSPVPRPSTLPSRSSTLAGSNKGPGKAVGGPKAGTMTRSKSLNKRTAAHPAAGILVETSSASDSEVVIKKAGLQTVREPEKELPVHGDDSPRTDGEQEHDEVASPAVSTNAEEVTVDDFVPDQIQEQKQLEEEKEAAPGGGAEEAEEERAPVSGSPNEPVIEPVEETKPAVTREAPVKGSGSPGNEAQRRNDVIEEAKSKFLAKRKNSVLALVGAFETVMVMQEPKGQPSQPPRKNKDVEVETKEASEPAESEAKTDAEESNESAETNNEAQESTEDKKEEEESKESTELTESNESAEKSEVIAPMVAGADS